MKRDALAKLLKHTDTMKPELLPCRVHGCLPRQSRNGDYVCNKCVIEAFDHAKELEETILINQWNSKQGRGHEAS